MIGLVAFRRWLDEQPRARIPLETLRRVFAEQTPECPGSELRPRLREVLGQLQDEGVLTLPAQTARNWDTVGDPSLPRFITRVRTKVLRKDYSQVSWVPALSFAPEVRQTKLLDSLVRINEFLITHRLELEPAVPFRERSLQIFGDEKYLDNAVSGELLYGRMPLSAIGAINPDPPLPREDFPAPGKPLLLVENHHTYWSLVNWNTGVLAYASVAYGAGNTIMKSEGALASALQRSGASHAEYFGDLDPAGLAIPLTLNAGLARLGLGPVQPAVWLYQLLLRHGVRRPLTTSKKQITPPAAWLWLPDDLRSSTMALFESGEWLPQEGVGPYLDPAGKYFSVSA